jgi:hypothetical protein
LSQLASLTVLFTNLPNSKLPCNYKLQVKQEPKLLDPDNIAPAFIPVLMQRRRHDGWTPQRQRAFIEVLKVTG